MFSIDTENNIAVSTGVPAAADNLQTFASEKELAKFAADWPASRLVEVWNSFAGVTPFDDLKPVKKFTSRKLAVARIWAAVQRLSPDGAEQARDVAPAAKGSKKSPAKAPRRAKGATLAEIMETTGWQRHTVRGFVSILGSKGGLKIESAKNTAGDRTYRIAK